MNPTPPSTTPDNAARILIRGGDVFDGSGDHARDEDAPTGPLNVYGQTKLEGEEAFA